MSAIPDAQARASDPIAQASIVWPSITLDAEALADLELLLLGGFGRPPRYVDGGSTVDRGTTVGGGTTVEDNSPTLDVEPAAAEDLVPGTTVALRDLEGVLIAALRLSSLTNVEPTATSPGRVRLGGAVDAVALPRHPDYPQLWRTPAEVQADLARQLPSVEERAAAVAVWADGLLHTADLERIARLRAAGHYVVVLAAAGGADPADSLHHLRVRCLRAALDTLTDASPATDASAVPLVLVPLRPARITAALADRTAAVYGLPISVTGPSPGSPGTEAALDSLRADGTPLPAGLTPAAVADELARAYPPRHRRGLAVLFTGLSGSGKSTLANLLTVRLLERGDGREVTLLDGDVVRTHLSKGLGFSREDRDTNVRRIGFVAAEAAGAGGTAVCAPIAPFAVVRAEVRAMVAARRAGFVLVHVSTPVEVCEARDRKGLYAKARAGLLPAFTGVSDPYEVPDDAEVVVDTSVLSPQEAVAAVLDYLSLAGWVD